MFVGNKSLWQLKYQRGKKLQAGGSCFLTNLGIPSSKSQGEPSIFPQQQVWRQSLEAPDHLNGLLLPKSPAISLC